MTDQLRINDAGELEVDSRGPLTWDGEPLWCPETVQEGLFSTEPFKQMPGQLPIEEEAKERSTCSVCLARTYRNEECVCDDGGDAEDYDEIVWRHETR